MTCIVDFNGKFNGFPVSFWADYVGATVKFGGDWSDVPDWYCPTEPTRQEVQDYATKHSALFKEEA